MFRCCCKASLVLPLLASALFAGSKIEFDTKTFNCGTAIEGKTEKIKASFTVKNTGDAVLKLESVRPGCGCTIVKYDTLIQPGKTAKIESEVNIKGYRSGPISKGITVTSNAENEPTVQLTIEALVKAIVDISENYLSLDGTNTNLPKSLLLTSKKTDLKVSDVSFKTNDNSGPPDWQSNLPLPIKFKWVPTDTIRPDGYQVFKLDIYTPSIDKTVSGEFIIKTNHPDKPEINLPGMINK